MSLSTAKTLLKVMGILSIIGAVLFLILGALTLVGGGVAAANPAIASEVQADSGTLVTVIAAGIVFLVSGLISLLEGIFSIRASKDSSKYKGAWIFALISVVFGVLGIIMTLVSKTDKSSVSDFVSVAVSVVTFIAANTVKKDALGQ